LLRLSLEIGGAREDDDESSRPKALKVTGQIKVPGGPAGIRTVEK
jgi:hypothetical protein